MNRKEIVRDIIENAWSKQDFSRLDEQISPDMVLRIRGSEMKVSVTGLKKLVMNWKSTFPDIHFEIKHLISEGDLVAVHCIFHGTPEKNWKGYEPQGKSIAVPHAFFMKFENEKVVEVWEVNDFTVLEGQLGVE